MEVTMFCYNCSQEVITGSRFCHKCGSEVGEMKNQSVADQTKPGARANTCAKRPVQSALSQNLVAESSESEILKTKEVDAFKLFNDFVEDLEESSELLLNYSIVSYSK